MGVCIAQKKKSFLVFYVLFTTHYFILSLEIIFFFCIRMLVYQCDVMKIIVDIMMTK